MPADLANQLKTRGAVFAALIAMILAPSAQAFSSNNNVTEEFHKTVPLSANGRVSLENINGNVEITGWDKNDVQIDAVKSARDQQRLDEAKIEVEGSGDAVHIRTRYPEGSHDNLASVHYTLHVPQGSQLEKISLVNGNLEISQVLGDVEASLVNGKLTAHDLSGRARLSTVNGTSDVGFRSLTNVRDVKISAVNGSINLVLPASPNAEISASTVNGNIKSDFPIQVETNLVGKRVKGTLGSGGTQISLSNVNGSTHIGPGM